MTRWTPRSRPARRRLALAVTVLWLLGFEVLPGLHVALHDQLAPHTHTVNGTIVTVSFSGGTHIHPDGTVHRDGEPEAGVAGAARKARADGRAHLRTPTPVEHGNGSLAHHGVAVLAPAAVVTTPLPVDRRPTTVAVVVSFELVSRARGRATARGPPGTLATI